MFGASRMLSVVFFLFQILHSGQRQQPLCSMMIDVAAHNQQGRQLNRSTWIPLEIRFSNGALYATSALEINQRK